MRYPPERAHGRTLLESCVSLAILTPLLWLFVRCIGSGTGTSAVVLRWGERASRALLMRGYLERVCAQLDHHRLPVPVRISPASTLVLSDGSVVELPRTSPGSTVLLWLELAPERRRSVRSRSPSGEVTACLDDPGAPRVPEEGRGRYLGIGAGGLLEVERLRETNLPHGCAAFLLVPLPSAVLPPGAQVTVDELTMILPITAGPALLVDTAESLRWIGLRGAAIVENQPLRHRFGPVRFELRALGGSGPLEIGARIGRNRSGEPELLLRTHHRLSRLSPRMVLFNGIW